MKCGFELIEKMAVCNDNSILKVSVARLNWFAVRAPHNQVAGYQQIIAQAGNNRAIKRP